MNTVEVCGTTQCESDSNRDVMQEIAAGFQIPEELHLLIEGPNKINCGVKSNFQT